MSDLVEPERAGQRGQANAVPATSERHTGLQATINPGKQSLDSKVIQRNLRRGRIDLEVRNEKASFELAAKTSVQRDLGSYFSRQTRNHGLPKNSCLYRNVDAALPDVR
jgi:hypothetical protein